MANEQERQTPGPGPTGGEPRDQIRAQDQQGGQAGTTTTEGGFVSGDQQPGEQRSFAEGDPGGGQGQREAESYRGREDLGQQNLGGGSATGQGSPGQDFGGRGDGQGEVQAEAEDVRPEREDRRQ